MSKNLRYYRISEPDLRELLMAAYTYNALEAGGVDNWDWYGESIHDFIDACSDIDGVQYEDMEEIVESSICQFPICSCGKTSAFETMLEGMGIE
jgi:hypothetical protein